MSKLDPKLCKALKDLSATLKKAGYAPNERVAIVDGATERARDFLEAHPDSQIEEAVALIASYKDPQLAPQSEGDAPLDKSLARFAWMTVSVAMLGILCVAPIISLVGGDGGAIMVLFAATALPLATVLSFLARRSRSGRLAGSVTLCATASVIALFLLAT